MSRVILVMGVILFIICMMQHQLEMAFLVLVGMMFVGIVLFVFNLKAAKEREAQQWLSADFSGKGNAMSKQSPRRRR